MIAATSSRQQKESLMVIVRNVFRLKFGKAREAAAVMKDAIAIQKRLGVEAGQRLLTDMTGPFYTLILRFTAWPPQRRRCPRSRPTRNSMRTTRSSCRWWSPATARY
jgi:hypothetical protein